VGGTRIALTLGLAVALLPGPAGAWIYPEHRDILAQALTDLPADQQKLFAALWADARRGRESRYCATMVDGDLRSAPGCIGLAAWAGIAGDHSFSPDQLVATTRPSNWILKVARVSAETKVGFEKATTREAKQNAAAINNLKLQFVDKEYTTRAGANNGHFLTTRTSDDPKDYLVRTLGAEAEPNAIGLYLYYHLGALGLARQWAAEADPAARTELARKVLATEAFAIHFLEDTFAAGHVAGSWGNVAERKGTHDYYSEFGLDTLSWNGSPFTTLGDGYMRPQDLTRAARVVALSLGQIFEATRTGTPAAVAAGDVTPTAAAGAAGFDSCTATRQPTSTVTAKTAQVALKVAGDADPGPERERRPRPASGRRSAPFGFPGISTADRVGGFQSGIGNARWWGGAEVEFRVGFGSRRSPPPPARARPFSVSDLPTTRPSPAARSQLWRRLELRWCPPGRDSPSGCECRSTSSPSTCSSQPRSWSGQRRILW
jgi:hypothetical protein